jgi:hypothetical protein
MSSQERIRQPILPGARLARVVSLVVLLSAVITQELAATDARTFRVSDIVAESGTVASGNLHVPDGPDGTTSMPVTVVHGAKPGPVLALCAGIHGSEYAPVIALQGFRSEIDPAKLSGVLILVHVANPPSFFGRSVYYSPADHKSPNTTYPGKADGSVTERIAFVLTNEIVERSDYLVDIHAGEANETLIPYVAYDAGALDPAIIKKSEAMASAFGFSIIKRLTGRPRNPAASGSLSNTEGTRGKPTIAIESGELGERDGEAVSRIDRGIWSLLRYLGMTEGTPSPSDHPLFVEDDLSIRSSVEGIFYPTVERGSLVNQGALLAYVTDFFGNRISEVRAPFRGIVLYLLAAPPVSKGEILVSLGHPVGAGP